MKRNQKGFTLIEMLVTIVILVLLVMGITVGTNAAVRAYQVSIFESDCGTLSDILTTTIGDVLRYSENVDGEGNSFHFSNYDYNVSNVRFAIQSHGNAAYSGYVIMTSQSEGSTSEDNTYYVVNKGAYTDDLVVSDISVTAHTITGNINNKYYFDVSYTIQSLSNSELQKSYSFRIRQANADILSTSSQTTTKPTQQTEEKERDKDYVTIVYDGNVPTNISDKFVITTFWGTTASFTQTINTRNSTLFQAIGVDDVHCDWYTLSGWSLTKDGAIVLTAGQEGDINNFTPDAETNSITLYAKYTPTVYKINYYENKTDTSPKTTQLFSQSSGTITLANSSAFSRTKEFTVTLDANSGTFAKGVKSSIDTTSTISGWVLNDSKTYNTGASLTVQSGFIQGFDPKTTKEIKLVAKWDTKVTNLPTSSSISRTGWVFKGWYSQNTLVGSSFTYNGISQITAGWEATLTFRKTNQDGTAATAATTFLDTGNSDKKASFPPDTFKSNPPTEYTTGGWYKDSAYKNSIADVSALTEYVKENGSSDVYLKWVPKHYYVRFVGNGNTNNVTMSNQEFEYDTDQALHANEFKKEYAVSFNAKGLATNPVAKTATYTFTGWKTDGGTSYADKATIGKTKNNNLTTTSNAVVNLNAQWSGGTITLPSVSNNNWEFVGWYNGSTQATNETKFTSTTTLTARWKCKVFFDANTGVSASGSVLDYIYDGDELNFFTTPTKEGHEFVGWFTEATGGVQLNTKTELTNHVKSKGNCTVYAHWKILKYRITTETDDESTTIKINEYPQSRNHNIEVEYGSTVNYSLFDKDGIVKVEFSYLDKDNKVISTTTTSKPATNTNFTFTMPACNVKIYVDGDSSSCISGDTLVTMEDGSKKMAKDVQAGDMLLTWDFNNGCYAVSPVVFNDMEEIDDYSVLVCDFADGTSVEVVSEHGFFDVELKKFVYFGDDDGTEYIGHHFIKQAENGEWATIALIDTHYEKRHTILCSPVTYGTLCLYTNDMLSMPGGISGLFNIYEVDTDTMRYNQEQKQKDMETYGLFTLDDFGGMITEDAFNAFNGADLKVAIGKGILSWNDIRKMAERYIPLM